MTTRVAAIALLALSGCATSAPPAWIIKPAANVISPAMATADPAKAALQITRDSGIVGAGCSIRLFVDAAPAVDLAVAETITLYVAAGEHLLSIRPNGICGGGGEHELQITTKAGDTRRYRVGADSGMSVRIMPTAF